MREAVRRLAICMAILLHGQAFQILEQRQVASTASLQQMIDLMAVTT